MVITAPVVSAPNEALCICNDGYYRDDLNCVPDADPCSEATCGDNGTCVVSGTNEALCNLQRWLLP